MPGKMTREHGNHRVMPDADYTFNIGWKLADPINPTAGIGLVEFIPKGDMAGRDPQRLVDELDGLPGTRGAAGKQVIRMYGLRDKYFSQRSCLRLTFTCQRTIKVALTCLFTSGLCVPNEDDLLHAITSQQGATKRCKDDDPN